MCHLLGYAPSAADAHRIADLSELGRAAWCTITMDSDPGAAIGLFELLDERRGAPVWVNPSLIKAGKPSGSTSSPCELGLQRVAFAAPSDRARVSWLGYHVPADRGGYQRLKRSGGLDMGLDSRSSTGILALGAADGRMTACGCLLFCFSLWLAGGCAYQVQQRAKGWLLIETEHIRVRTSMDRAPAVRLAIEMQHIRDVLASYALPCAFQGTGDHFPVTALPSSQYDDFAPENAAAFYRSTKISGPSDYEAQMIIPDGLGLDASAVFRHEMTHHLLALCLRGAPRWLHEGLAKFLETTRTDSGKTTFGTPPYVFVDSAQMDIRRVLYKDQHVEVLPFYILPSIHDIIATDSDVWKAHDLLATVAMYAAAWGLIHFLELGAPDLHPRFEAYLQSLQQFDGDPQALFVKTFEGVPLQDRLDGYLKRGDFPLLGSRSSTVVERKVNVSVREMGEDEGHLQMAWLWSGVRGKQGQDRFLQHLAAAKQSPRMRATADVLGALSR